MMLLSVSYILSDVVRRASHNRVTGLPYGECKYGMTLLAMCLKNRRRNAAASKERGTKTGREGESLASSTGSKIIPLLTGPHN